MTITQIILQIVLLLLLVLQKETEFDLFDSTRDETEQQTVDESDQDIIEQNFQALANAGSNQLTENVINQETEMLIETNGLEASSVNGCLQKSTGIGSHNQSDVICHNSQFEGLILKNSTEFNESNSNINFTEPSGLEVETEAGEVNDSFPNTINIVIELDNQPVMTNGNAQRKCKQQAIFQTDAMIENVGKEQQQDILSSALSQTEKDTIAHADVSSTYEGIVVNLPIEHLVRFKNENKYSIMYQYISDIFAEHLDDLCNL